MSNNETTKMPPKMKGPGPMGGPHGGHGPAEKAKDIKGTTKKLAGLLSKYKIGMACKKNYFISIIFSLCAGLILYSIRPSVFNLVIQHQNYGSEIYMFNSLYFYYYFILFLTAILIPVNFISRMIYLEIKYQ